MHEYITSHNIIEFGFPVRGCGPAPCTAAGRAEAGGGAAALRSGCSTLTKLGAAGWGPARAAVCCAPPRPPSRIKCPLLLGGAAEYDADTAWYSTVY